MSTIAVGTKVQTPYGVGKVNSFREEGQLYQIELTEWVLSEGQKVFVYSQASQFKVVAEEEKKTEATVVADAPAAAVVVADEVKPEEPKKQEFAVGVEVKSAYGVGKIVAIRDEDKMFQVELTNWTLSDNQKVHIFCQASQIQFTTTNTDAAVVAVEGEAVAVEAEPEAPKVVKTPYGQGTVVAFREEDQMFQIELSSWTLSDNQKVYIFCQADQFKVINEAGEEAVVKVPANTKAAKGDGKGCCNIM